MDKIIKGKTIRPKIIKIAGCFTINFHNYFVRNYFVIILIILTLIYSAKLYRPGKIAHYKFPHSNCSLVDFLIFFQYSRSNYNRPFSPAVKVRMGIRLLSIGA